MSETSIDPQMFQWNRMSNILHSDSNIAHCWWMEAMSKWKTRGNARVRFKQKILFQ